MMPSRRYRLVRVFLQAALVALVYVLGIRVGLARLPAVSRDVSAVWPPAGIGVAVLLLAGRKVWPGVFVGSLVGYVLAGAPGPIVLGLSAGNTLVALVGAGVLSRLELRPTFERLSDAKALVVGAGAAMTVGAVARTLTIVAARVPGGETPYDALTWGVGGIAGILVLTPVVLVLAKGSFESVTTRRIEATAAMLATALGAWAIFHYNQLMPYLAVILVVVVAVRYRQLGAVVSTLIVVGIGLLATATDPFSLVRAPEVSDTTRLMLFQSFAGTIAMTALLLAILMDERLSAERKLRRAAEHLERRVRERSDMLLESQQLARIGSFRWDAATNANSWTDELFRIYGLDPSGQAPTFERYLSFVHPDDRDRVEVEVQRAIAERRPFDHDYRITHPSRTERWVHAHGEVLTDESGAIAGLRGTCQDITERKQAERAVKASEERFRSLIEWAPDAAIVADQDGVIVFANEQSTRLFGFEHDELEGRHVEMLIPTELREVHRTHRGHFVGEPARRPMGTGQQLFAVRKDGTRFPVDVSLSPVETEGGMLVVASVRDITERRRAEESMRLAYEREREAAEDLRRLDAAKSAFLEAVSHELRTPLTVILGTASLIHDGQVKPGDPAFSELVANLDRSAQHLGQLLDDLLDLEKLTRGILPSPERKPTPIPDLVTQVISGIDPRSHRISIDVEDFTANIDPDLAERILFNLVANAVRHTPPGTSVWIEAKPSDGGVLVCVEDSGPGVPSNIREHVFDPFIKNTRSHTPGAGIGLSLVARFAELHGGRAWLEDRADGGSVFSVLLPGDTTRTGNDTVADATAA